MRGEEPGPLPRPSEVSMPEWEHSCFFSYKHPPNPDPSDARPHFWLEFIQVFQAKLKRFMTDGLPMYRDDRLRSVPGAHYPVELSRNLCRSVCMIAILVPEYLESTWCKAEWNAMEQLERERAVNPDAGGFIIPILFRGDEEKAATFCGPRVFLDFRHIVKPATQLDTMDSRRRLENIGQQVARLARHHSPTDCSKFAIDIGPERADPVPDGDPNPLV
jgi:TIR domain